MSIVTVRGQDIHFIERGDPTGRPTLLLHSTGVGSIQWLRFARRLKDRHCLIPDFMNYAPSPDWVGEGPPDWQIDRDAVVKMVLAQDQPVDIVGHSYGGHIALHVAHDHPDRVRFMALHEPIAWGVFQNAGPLDMREAFLGLRERFFPTPALSPEEWLRKFVDYWNADGDWERLPERRKEVWRERFVKIHYEVKHLSFDPYSLDQWRNIDTPILLTVSENATPEEGTACQLLAEHLSHTVCVQVPGGHMAPLTHAAAVLPVLAGGIKASYPQ
jgi:pimeloyl-ACP methyl ester carboxylesterase